ncbi:type VI secretion system lipoprotein TssJ [Parashewanella tropica]|uniref:type VI secretion system lipoprotein TssJ n=1 Tax=Parashewanella tropica TaxID=2547970 RepID=UPI00105A2B44|nr:type VI secretion system lipoprotein TssJ [Parashewanella tropica]
MKRILLVMMLAVLLQGCSLLGFGKPAPKTLTVMVSASYNINPNLKNNATPIKLRVYQLSDSEVFNQASFLNIFNDEQGVLKASLLSVRHLKSIIPGEKYQQVYPLLDGTKYIAILAGFSDYQEANDKAIFPISSDSSQTVNIDIDGINLSIQG